MPERVPGLWSLVKVIGAVAAGAEAAGLSVNMVECRQDVRCEVPGCACDVPQTCTKMLRGDLHKRGFVYTMYIEAKSGAAATKMADDRHRFVLLSSTLTLNLLLYLQDNRLITVYKECQHFTSGP